MNIGEKIKQLRTEKNLTQPQLAEAIGIEQSYLSKLENDKSVPSADIFASILHGLQIDVGSFLQGVDEAIVQGSLKQIPEVALYLNARASIKLHSIKRWLFSSAISCVLGLSMIIAAEKCLLFSSVEYEYVSNGVLHDGEPSDFIESWKRYEAATPCDYMIKDDCKDKREVLAAKEKIMATRQVVETIFTTKNQGKYIYKNVESGRRVFELRQVYSILHLGNRIMELLGVMLFCSGIFGFFVEFRLRKI